MRLSYYKSFIPSGVEWLGNIPSTWEIRRLRFVGDAIIGLTYDPTNISNAEGGTLVLRASNIQESKLVQKDNVYIDMVIPKKLLLRLNDILICSRNGSRELIGKKW